MKIQKLNKKEQLEINKNYLSFYLQTLWETADNLDIVKELMENPAIITRMPIECEKIKGLAALIYVYYQLMEPYIQVEFDSKNGNKIVRITDIDWNTPF